MARSRKGDPMQYFWGSIDFSRTCWLWNGRIDRHGYGTFCMGGKVLLAHRVAYEAIVGPIPEGLTIDHRCREKRCVNPAHLEAVSLRENIARALSFRAPITHCPQGHPYDEENTYVDKRGKRNCRTCKRERMRASRAKEQG